MSNQTLQSGDRLHDLFREGTRGRPAWDYPELRDSGTNENLSNVAFDLLICVGISLVAITSLIIKFNDGNFFMGVKEKVNSAARDSYREPLTIGPFRKVSHVTKESFFLWFSVMTTVAFITFKILSGSREADAGQIFLVILVALFARMLSQETAGAVTSKVAMSVFPTGMAIVATYLGYIGYTKADDYYQRDKVNGWYISGMVFGAVAMLFKTFQVIFENGNSDKKVKTDDDSSKVSGEYMYPIRLMDVVVFSFVSMFFFIFEAIVVARADIKLYAVPFWGLWILPIYCIITQIVQAAYGQSGVGVSIFNVVVALHALAIIWLGQMQVCSLYRIDDSHALFTELNADAAVSRGPVMCPGRWGLYMHDKTENISMHKSAIWLLSIITSLFFTASYTGATFTRYQMELAFKEKFPK